MTPDTPPVFAKGDHVTVDPHSALAYEPFTRKGAVGVIMRADKMVRGIRRYQMLFEEPQTGGRRATRIREEHMVKAEPPAPRQYATARHAYEYRAEKKLRSGERLWCDAFGCFEDTCAVCKQHPAQHATPTLFPPIGPAPEAQSPAAPSSTPSSTQMPYSTAVLATLDTGDAYEFAVALVREQLERGMSRDVMLVWQSERQWIYTVGGGTCYDVTRGGFYLTMLRGQKCSIRYALKALVAEAERRIAGVPRQVGLWGSAVRA